MNQQIPLSEDDRADGVDRDDGTREIAPDLAYIRTIMDNVGFYGLPDGGDRSWVLTDAGVIGGRRRSNKQRQSVSVMHHVPLRSSSPMDISTMSARLRISWKNGMCRFTPTSWSILI